VVAVHAGVEVGHQRPFAGDAQLVPDLGRVDGPQARGHADAPRGPVGGGGSGVADRLHQAHAEAGLDGRDVGPSGEVLNGLPRPAQDHHVVDPVGPVLRDLPRGLLPGELCDQRRLPFAGGLLQGGNDLAVPLLAGGPLDLQRLVQVFDVGLPLQHEDRAGLRVGREARQLFLQRRMDGPGECRRARQAENHEGGRQTGRHDRVLPGNRRRTGMLGHEGAS